LKYLVLFAVLFIAYLVWRSKRVEQRPQGGAQAPGPGAPQAMVSCAVCGLHLPQPDALRGADGRFFCSQEHRLTAGS
jgi:uncharacterized protein